MFQAVGERYELEKGRILGHGAFAIVFRGRDKQSGQLVAVKQINIRNTGGKLSVGKKEIDILKKLKNTNIVQLHEVVEEKNFVFLVMEYCNGGDLGEYLQARKTLSEDSIRHFGNHIANGLQALCTLDIIHRDLKPQNLLLSFDPRLKSPPIKEIMLKIADFGFARHLSRDDMAATLCGSPLYMAPEVLLGHKYDSLADLWSVGTVLYQCLTGEPPYKASNPSALRKKYHKDDLVPVVPAYASQSLCDLLLRLLKKNPKERMTFTDFFAHPFLAGALRMPEEDSLPFQSLRPSPSPAIPIGNGGRGVGAARRRKSSFVMRTDSPRSSGMVIGSAESSYSSSIEPPSFGPNAGASPVETGSIRTEEDGEYVYVHNSKEYSSSGSSRRGSTSSRVSGYGTPKSHTSSLSASPIATPFFPASPRNTELLTNNPPSSLQQFTSGSPKLPFGSLQPPRIPQSLAPKSQMKTPGDASPHQPSPVVARRPHYHPPLATNGPVIPSQRESPKRRSSFGRQPLQNGSPVQQGGTMVRNLSEGNQLYRLQHNAGPVSQPSSLPTISPLGVPLSQPGGLESLLRSDAREEGILNGEKVRSRSDHQRFYTREGSLGDLPRNDSNISLQSCDSQGKGSTSSSSDNFYSMRGSSPQPDSGQESDHSSVKSIEEDNMTSLRGTHIPFSSLNVNNSPLHSPNVDSALTFPFSLHTSGDSLLTPVAKCHSPAPPWAAGVTTPVSLRVVTEKSDSQLVENVAMSESTATIQGEESDVDGQTPECLLIMQRSMMVAEEVLRMAHSLVEEEPLLHISHDVFSLSSSSSMEDPIRFQEQLVLLVKGVQVLKTGLRAVELEDASLAEGSALTPEVKTAQDKVLLMLQQCREEAAAVKEKVQETRDGNRQQCVTPAEKMMYLRAMRLCEEAALEEKFGTKPLECARCYKIAQCLLQQLQTEAQSRKDRAVLQKYLHFLEFRLAAPRTV